MRNNVRGALLRIALLSNISHVPETQHAFMEHWQMARKFLRYQQLKDAGIVRNRPGIVRAQEQVGFPKPYRLGVNIVAWADDEIEAWLRTRKDAAPLDEGRLELARQREVVVKATSAKKLSRPQDSPAEPPWVSTCPT